MRSAADRLVRSLRRQVADPRVLDAIRAVPREAFVPVELTGDAWENRPLPIGEGQTISQPLVVARMCALLELQGGERVLDVGTGSGYHAALLARLAAPGPVVSVERHASLARGAAERLERLGVRTVEVRVGDGAEGAPDAAPFDAINVAAACTSGAVPAALEAQLAPGGRLVAPVGEGDRQHLVLVLRSTDGAGLERRRLEGVRFVPLVS